VVEAKSRSFIFSQYVSREPTAASSPQSRVCTPSFHQSKQVDIFKSSLESGIMYCNSGIAGTRNVTVPSYPGGNSDQKNLGES
jgi:hypothetical protein